MADSKQGGTGLEMARAGGDRSEAKGAAGGFAQQARLVARQMQQRVAAMPAKRRTWLLGAMLFVAAGVAGLGWFWQRPDWRVLFSGLDAKDVQTVSQELAAAGIPFEATADGGGVEVPADMLDKARMEVAAKGMPQTGRLGFELFDKPNWVGSEFDERVNYQRALEGELEHTIGSLGVVRSARVHLVLPQATLFSAQEKVAKASVVLKLRKSTVSQEQADSIRALVAGAVENLSADDVALVDAEGRVNLSAKGRGSAAESEMEQALEAKLVAMLEPVAGRENVRATVNVSYDEGSVDRTDEVYDPAQQVALTTRKSEQNSGLKGGAAAAGGIPGTASNTPAASVKGSQQAAGASVAAGTPPLLKEPLPVYPGGAAGGQTMKEESDTYGVTRHVTHSEQGPGRVRRITAAVVVNDRAVMDGSGKSAQTVWKPRSADEMKRLEQLAQAAVGFDDKRGDQVVMSNVSFLTNAPEAKPAPLAKVLEEGKSFLHTEPALLRTGVMGLVALGVVMLVLRPMAQQVIATLKQPVLLAAGSPMGSVSGGMQRFEDAGLGPGLGAGAGGSAPALGAPVGEGSTDLVAQAVGAPAAQAKRRAMKQGQVMFEHVADQISREPIQSTRLLEVWIGSADGGE